MPTYTTNLHLAKPLVNNATDQDLWGDELNENMDILDAAIPAVLPLGCPVPYCGTSEPSGWLFCYGQSLDTTTYANLFAVLGYTYGGAGASFNLPDLRGRGIFGRDDMGGSSASRITNGVSGITGTTLGASGGSQSMQSHTHTASVTDPGHTHTVPQRFVALSGGSNGFYLLTPQESTLATSSSTTGITVSNSTEGSGSSQNMPPAIILNWIMKDGL